MPVEVPKLRTIWIMLPDAVISERRDLWIALSDLFLDTDVRLSYPYVARVAAETPYSMDELEAIYRNEVAPIVEDNLLEVAGEWAMFPEEWLVSAIAARGAEPYVMLTGAIHDWQAVAHLTQRLRAMPPEERMARTQLWDRLKLLFMDPNPPMPKDLPIASLLREVLREDMQPAYLHEYSVPAGFEDTCRGWLESAETTR